MWSSDICKTVEGSEVTLMLLMASKSLLSRYNSDVAADMAYPPIDHLASCRTDLDSAYYRRRG